MSQEAQASDTLNTQVQQLAVRVKDLEATLAAVVSFMNAKFGAPIQQNTHQYNQPNDRNDVGMGAILSADRSSFI